MQTNAKEKQLISIGYHKEWLQMMQDPKYSHVRFSLDDLLAIEDLKDKRVIITTKYANETKTVQVICTKTSVAVIGCALYTSCKCCYTNITNKSIQHYRKTGEILIDNSRWKLNPNGTMSPALDRNVN